MKNITITLDEDTAAWAREHAARRQLSLSRFVSEMLAERMRESAEYDQAMRRWLSRGPSRLQAGGGRYPTREEAHDRTGLR